MADKTRTDLLREIRELSERVQEQDRRLARMKKGASKPRTPKPPPLRGVRNKSPRNSSPYFESHEFLDWFADAVEAFAPARKGLVEVDGAGRVRAISGGVGDALGVSLDQLIGAPWEQWIADDDRARWRDFRANANEARIEKSLSFRLQSRVDCARLRGIALRPPSSEPVTWIVLYKRPQRDSPTPAESAANRWAGVFAHELNQPLASVLTTAQACRGLLTSGAILPEELAQGLDGLIRGVRHAAEVVRRLRTLAGGDRPQFARSNLHDVVRHALEVLKDLIDESKTTAIVDIAPDFPAVKIDATQIVQVLVNLIRNAIEAASSLPVSRRQLTVRARVDSREALVCVEDGGVGLSVDAIHGLFEPLASAKPTGMGLGLALCRQIVEAHGGRIWAKRNVPHGCLFSFTFLLDAEEP